MEFRDKLVFVDNSGMVTDGHAIGVSAFVTHVGGFWPEYWLDIYDALEEHNYAGAYELLGCFKYEWGHWRAKVEAETGGEGAFIKAALEICGLPAGAARLPSARLSAALFEEGRQLLLKHGVPGAK
jgi:dihydrodipicolinate synthase/N-acetylneuraminate lyase